MGAAVQVNSHLFLTYRGAAVQVNSHLFLTYRGTAGRYD